MRDKPYEITLERMTNVAGDLIDSYFVRSIKGITSVPTEMTGLPDDITVGMVVTSEGLNQFSSAFRVSWDIALFVPNEYRPPRP